MSQFIISSSGDLIEGGALGLRHYLGRFSAQGDLAAFAIRNLGFVQIEEGRATRVRFRPAMVHGIAFARAVTWLADSAGNRCIVSWFDDAWHDELHATKVSAIARMVDLVATHQGNDHERLVSKEVPLDRLDMIPLIRLVERWSELGGIYDRERLASTFE